MNFISSWAQGIIVAVIVVTIIEMLLPSNGNGKYIKVIAGIFVLFSIVSPVVSKFKGSVIGSSLDWDSYIESSASGGDIQTSGTILDTGDSIKKMYEENLKIDIKSKISQKGYTIGEIDLGVSNDDKYVLNSIKIKIIAKNEATNQNGNSQKATTIVENIENVKISLGGSSKDKKQHEQSIISESEKRKLREYLSGVYEVNENNIIVN